MLHPYSSPSGRSRTLTTRGLWHKKSCRCSERERMAFSWTTRVTAISAVMADSRSSPSPPSPLWFILGSARRGICPSPPCHEPPKPTTPAPRARARLLRSRVGVRQDSVRDARGRAVGDRHRGAALGSAAPIGDAARGLQRHHVPRGKGGAGARGRTGGVASLSRDEAA